MRFVDHCRIRVIAGDGGNGVVAFRREKFIPFGGPSGGDGGKGGDVLLETAEGLSSLSDVVYQHTIKADRGEHGQGNDCYGRAGADKVVRVPPGTQVFDHDTDELICDLVEHGQRVVIAKGGRGGRGNIHFATPFDRAPRKAEKGEVGENRNLRFELKVMADVGLLGFPNVGKSTFVASVSAARPRVADYPFTTLTPTLGVVNIGGGPRLGGASFVAADIPGLIPGASEGVGLGVEFLKHVERTRVLLHLVSLDEGENRSPVDDYVALRKELTNFSKELSQRPEIVALSKADMPEVQGAYPALAKAFAKRGVQLRLISAANRTGIEELLIELFQRVQGVAREEAWEAPAPKTRVERAPKRSTAAPVKEAAPKRKAAPKKVAPKKKAAAPKKKVAAPKRKAAAPKRKAAAPKKKAAAPKRRAAAPKKKAAAPKKKAVRRS